MLILTCAGGADSRCPLAPVDQGPIRQSGISARTQRATAKCHRLPGCLAVARCAASVAMGHCAAVYRCKAANMRHILVRTVLTAGLLAGASAAKSATMKLSN